MTMNKKYDFEHETYQQWLSGTRVAVEHASREVRRASEYFAELDRRNKNFLKWYEQEMSKSSI